MRRSADYQVIPVSRSCGSSIKPYGSGSSGVCGSRSGVGTPPSDALPRSCPPCCVCMAGWGRFSAVETALLAPFVTRLQDLVPAQHSIASWQDSYALRWLSLVPVPCAGCLNVTAATCCNRRLAPLMVEPQAVGGLHQIQEGDCVIAVSGAPVVHCIFGHMWCSCRKPPAAWSSYKCCTMLHHFLMCNTLATSATACVRTRVHVEHMVYFKHVHDVW